MMDGVDEGKIVSDELVLKYLKLTQAARAKVAILPKAGSVSAQMVEILLKMADDYSSDAGHFHSKGDNVRAFGAINYAHAWLDAGVRLGLLDGFEDDMLFTLP